MNTFSNMKKNKKSLYDKIVQETNKMQSSEKSSADDRFWQPEVDKAGNGSAIVRFLPATQNESLPWVRLFSHGFQGPGGWYIENSLTTLGEQDPVGEFNTTLWNRGDDAGKDQARTQKRRLSYISNIYVVKDPARPEREGNVYLYKYGKKIFDKINDLMHPEFDDEEALNPFDLWEGANFRMKIRNFEGYRNYDKSEFGSPSALLEDDDELEAVWGKQFSLQDFLDTKNFKSYAELKAKMTRVLGLENVTSSNRSFADDVAIAEDSIGSAEPEYASSTSDDDDDMSFFKKLQSET